MRISRRKYKRLSVLHRVQVSFFHEVDFTEKMFLLALLITMILDILFFDVFLRHCATVANIVASKTNLFFFVFFFVKERRAHLYFFMRRCKLETALVSVDFNFACTIIKASSEEAMIEWNFFPSMPTRSSRINNSTRAEVQKLARDEKKKRNLCSMISQSEKKGDTRRLQMCICYG